VDVLDLVLGIEKVFGIRIGQDDDIKRHFESIQTLAAYIETQTQPQPEPLAA
jgi:acyl carrier protein